MKKKIDNELLKEMYGSVEFKMKYYKSKTLHFQPPTFEEFLNTKTDNTFPHWNCEDEDISIVMWEDEKEFLVDISSSYELSRVFKYIGFFEDIKEVYCKAVEYAMNYFLGKYK